MVNSVQDSPVETVKPYGHVLTGVRPPGPKEGYRIAAYQLIEYLELIGVEVIFGLCGHTNIAVLDALGKNKKVRFITTRHEQTAAHAVSYTHLRAHETRHDLVCR